MEKLFNKNPMFNLPYPNSKYQYMLDSTEYIKIPFCNPSYLD